jgi:hypothetical protein
VQRTRSAPPTSSTAVGDARIVSLPAELPALKVLVEEVRAPGATRTEVDALIAGLSQPLPPETSPREHADLLLSLMEDAQLADSTGTDGRTVRAAAIQALLALGYPYALEVSPEALEATVRDEGKGPGLLSTQKGKVGLGLVALAGILQFIPVIFFALEAPDSSPSKALVEFLSIGFILSSTFLPALLMVLGHKLGKAGLKTGGKIGLILASLLWLIPGILSSGLFPFNLIPMTLGGLILAGALLMSSRD